MKPAKKFFWLVPALFFSISLGQEAYVPDQGFLFLEAGEVEIESANGEKRKVVYEKKSEEPEPVNLKPGETIRTTGETICSISFPPFGVVRLEPDTETKLPVPDPDTETSLELLRGKLFLDVSSKNLAPTKQEFRIKLPTTILAVKGTRFFAEVGENGETIGVHSGEVHISRKIEGRSVVLRERKAITSTKGVFSPQRPLSEDESSWGDNYAEFGIRFEPAERHLRRFREVWSGKNTVQRGENRSLIATLNSRREFSGFYLQLPNIEEEPDFIYFRIQHKANSRIASEGWIATTEGDRIGFSHVNEGNFASPNYLLPLSPLSQELTAGQKSGHPELAEGEIYIGINIPEPFSGGFIKYEISPVFVGYRDK